MSPASLQLAYALASVARAATLSPTPSAYVDLIDQLEEQIAQEQEWYEQGDPFMAETRAEAEQERDPEPGPINLDAFLRDYAVPDAPPLDYGRDRERGVEAPPTTLPTHGKGDPWPALKAQHVARSRPRGMEDQHDASDSAGRAQIESNTVSSAAISAVSVALRCIFCNAVEGALHDPSCPVLMRRKGEEDGA